MRIRLALLAVVAAIALGGYFEAHGGGNHVMGTVTSVDAIQIKVKTVKGKALAALFDKETKYFIGKTPATLADVKIGMRIALHLTGAEETPTVREARLPAKK